MPTPKRKIKAFAVINQGKISSWADGSNKNWLIYDIFPQKGGARAAAKEWGYPAKIVPVEILLPKPSKKPTKK